MARTARSDACVLDELAGLGCEGAVASFGTEPARAVESMRVLAET